MIVVEYIVCLNDHTWHIEQEKFTRQEFHRVQEDSEGLSPESTFEDYLAALYQLKLEGRDDVVLVDHYCTREEEDGLEG